MSTESLLREILQEIREVKAHFVPVPAVSLRPSAVASAGGGSKISGLSAKNILSKVANASKSERAELASLLSSSKKAPNKVVAHDLYYNPAMEAVEKIELELSHIQNMVVKLKKSLNV